MLWALLQETLASPEGAKRLLEYLVNMAMEVSRHVGAAPHARKHRFVEEESLMFHPRLAAVSQPTQ
jgi:hypothetical protein